jgi:hypothetical protein
VPVPYAAVSLIERVLDMLPYRLRKPIADFGLMRALLGLRVAAIK